MFDKQIHLFSLKIYPNFLSETSPYCMNSIQRKIYLIYRYMLPLMTETHLLLQVLNMNNEKIERSYTITIFSYVA